MSVCESKRINRITRWGIPNGGRWEDMARGEVREREKELWEKRWTNREGE